jgi:2,5-diamino-6-(ribosylamino)-4(3H)-pyrimidinone 5'-phosphate reductase
VLRPHVVSHTLISVDGRLEGFPPDVARYYELAERLPHDAILAGSGTMVAAAADAGVDLTQDDEGLSRDQGPSTDPDRPLLIIIDSQGQLTRFDWLREAGLFGDVMVVGCTRTPESHLSRLRAADVEFEVFGTERVDLESALVHLREQRGIEAVRVDAGPGLNGALLAAGLLDEISVLLAPYLVGNGRSFLDGLTGDGPSKLELATFELQPDQHMWLRYSVSYG